MTYPPPPYQPPHQPAYAAPPPTSGYATTALLLGLAIPLTCGLTAIPAIILGHIARGETRPGGKRGRGMATTGLVLGYGAMLVALVAGVVAGLSQS